ncbi:uncharacterized protein LOC131163080 isoform X1 [Malania oleifera]|uniref:uncharacterized protein LOC131163080 isoform X1 n=1 Tax=Malania oleifera TaxID=397392 RepID=UPI0025AE078F|nr:uncharacterized protein LOC131163080 isoform X1 [Malania oleifera]
MDICSMSMSEQLSANSLRFSRVARNSIAIRRAPTSLLLRCASDSLLESNSRNRMFILGMGFVGQFVAQDLMNSGWVVSGTCRTTTRKKMLEERGLNVYLFDANEPEPGVLDTMKHHTHLLVSIPPVVGLGDPMLQHRQILRSRLMDGNLQWLCYLSSTSVYGNCGGAWVDEYCPVSPESELAKVRVAAEEGWLDLGHDLGLSAQIFRLGGIYGPGRSAVDTIIKQMPLSEAQKRRVTRQYTSRIHVADICQALKASSISVPSPRNIYNIVDDDPAPREEVFAFAKHLIKETWPNQIKKSTSPGMTGSIIQKQSSKREKRVSNSRMKKELGVKLIHPSYKSGLSNIIVHMKNPFG